MHYRFAFVYTGQKEMENLNWRCFICLLYISKHTIHDGKQQTKGPNQSAQTSSALQAFVLLFALFNKSRSKFSQVLSSVLRFRHSNSPSEDQLGKALLTC